MKNNDFTREAKKRFYAGHEYTFVFEMFHKRD